MSSAAKQTSTGGVISVEIMMISEGRCFACRVRLGSERGSLVLLSLCNCVSPNAGERRIIGAGDMEVTGTNPSALLPQKD